MVKENKIMEELNIKLNSASPLVVAQIISKLICIIKGKRSDDILELPEFNFLKLKCVCDNKAINTAAAEGILRIVREDNSLVKPVITDFITIVTTTKCSSNVTFLMNNLLVMDLENEVAKGNSYKSTYNLRLPQHPFLIMLNEDSNCWSLIFKEIAMSYKTGNKEKLCCCDELYKPLFLYALCSPQENLIAFKYKLWSFILQKEAFANSDKLMPLLLSWMQFENKATIETNSDFLIELSQVNQQRYVFDSNLLLLWQISALQQIIVNNFDPRDTIFSIMNSWEILNNHFILKPVLLILAQCINLCPTLYLLHLLKLCKLIIGALNLDIITKNIIKASLLHVISNQSELISETITYANNLFSLLQCEEISTNCEGIKNFNKNFQKVLSTSAEIYFTTQIYAAIDDWKCEEDVLRWIEKLDNAPIFFTTKTIPVLNGLLLTQFENVELNLKILELILKCIESDKNLAPSTLTIVLYKLTNTYDSKLHYHLLKAVPKMAVAKSNFQKIVTTIQVLNRGRGALKTFSNTLMFDLWKIDNKSYSYLENFLTEPCSVSSSEWEFFVTRTHILKELCVLKPELYGKEMVAHLSKILNECNNPDGALASALAIDGITALCKAEIIDAVTTWATLAPMFKAESRTPVIKSLCNLIAEIPSLSYSEAYPQLINEVVAKLWEYIQLNQKNDEVWKAALDALTHFSVEEIVSQTPDEYFDEEMLNLRRSGHIVPGTCWIHFLKECTESKLPIAGDFLIKLTSSEVSKYLKFVYQVKGTREPDNYSYLPANSVVGGISAYLHSKIAKWQGDVYKAVYLQCLRVFSQEYSRPLPPLNWCFLQELFHEPEAKDYCIDIAAHQVVLSGSARRFIVNYIEAIAQDTINDRDALLIYRNLKYLANSVQPFTLKPFLENSIFSGVQRFKDGNEDILKNFLIHVKDTLKNPNILEANKQVMAQILTDIFSSTEISDSLFDVLLECVILFPMNCIDELSSPKYVKEPTPEWFKKAIKIRCHLAINGNNAPLNLLNDLMGFGGSCPELTSFLFEEFAAVFEKHKNNTECVLWVLDLIGHVQAAIAEKSNEKDVILSCNVFILATVVFSGHSVFLKGYSQTEELYKLFPRAVATLLDVNHWSICTVQALEWFYHMAIEKTFNSEYKDMFTQCLQSLRHESEFQKNMKWTKYLNVAC